MTNLAISAYALCLGISTSDKQLATGFTPVLLVPMALFAGFFANRETIPKPIIILHYLSIYKYGWQALVLVR